MRLTIELLQVMLDTALLSIAQLSKYFLQARQISLQSSMRRDCFMEIEKDTPANVSARVSFAYDDYLAAPASLAPGTSSNFPVSTSYTKP